MIFIVLTAVLLVSVGQAQQVQVNVSGNLDGNVPTYDYHSDLDAKVPTYDYHGDLDANVPAYDYQDDLDAKVPTNDYHGDLDAKVPTYDYQGDLDAKVPTNDYQGDLDAKVPTNDYQGDLDAKVPTNDYHSDLDAKVPTNDYHSDLDAKVPTYDYPSDLDANVPNYDYHIDLDANVPTYDYYGDLATTGDVGITGDSPVDGDTGIGEQLFVDPITTIYEAVQSAQTAQQDIGTAAGQMQNLSQMGVIASHTGMIGIKNLMSEAQSVASQFTPLAYEQMGLIQEEMENTAAQINADLTAQGTPEAQQAIIALEGFLENFNVAVSSYQQCTADLHTIAQAYSKQLSDFVLVGWKEDLTKGQEFISKGQETLNNPATTPEMKELAQKLTLDGQKMISTVKSAMEQWPNQVSQLSNELEKQIQQQLSSGESTGAQLQKDISDIGQDWLWNTMSVTDTTLVLTFKIELDAERIMQRMAPEAANPANEETELVPEEIYNY